MPSHPIDFDINPNVFSTPHLVQVFDEKARYQRWLDFEAALARAQAETGVIPQEAADEIERKARLECLDLETVHEGYLHSRNSLMPLINGLRNVCQKGYGEYVHYGVTTQDVLDTAEILELRETLAIIYKDLRALEVTCLDLAIRHRSTPMVARTHGQQALPTTFGLKVVTWSSEIRRHIERAIDLFQRLAFGQLSGAVGTMAALGPHAMEVARRTLDLLGLRHRPLGWHNSRDHIGELACAFSLMVTTLAKMANEVFQLQKTEIGELSEPSLKGAVASSTMPHKKNPVICQRIVVLSRHVRHLAGTIVESMAHEHERDARCLWGEWLAVPQLSIHTGSALKFMLDVMSGLEVNVDRMKENLHLHKAMITSEWLLFKLSHTMGKMKSLEKLHGLSSRATDAGLSFKQSVMDDHEIGALLTSEEMEYLDRPERYIGHALEIVDQTVEEIEGKRALDPEEL
ncbi:MAG: adenylosuccinate lyase family protein [Thermodesulfobacteriota bacterium]|nr:adenylosuccinate lyase family protein [Thermodesulfobacteriota bacterium]